MNNKGKKEIAQDFYAAMDSFLQLTSMINQEIMAYTYLTEKQKVMLLEYFTSLKLLIQVLAQEFIVRNDYLLK